MAVLSTLKRKTAAGIGIGVVLLLIHIMKLRRRRRRRQRPSDQQTGVVSKAGDKDKRKRIAVDKVFFGKLWRLMKQCVFRNGVPQLFILFNAFLVLRTFLSIYIAGVKGKIVKGIIAANKKTFFKNMGNLALLAIPGSITNSVLNYFQNMLALNLRKGLVDSFNNKYVKGKTAYQLINIDSRIENPDQILTEDIEKWTIALSEFYCDFSKPLLDIVLFSRKLAAVMTYKGPALMIAWYVFSGYVIKLISPSFGRLVAEGLKREGTFRSGHQRLIQHSEEIAFLRGDKFEHNMLKKKLTSLLKLYKYENKLRFFMGIIDSMLVKYGAYNLGIGILVLPIFGPDKDVYLKRVGNDPLKIIRDYESNSSLLINLAKAIGKIVISYKKLQILAGSTHRIAEFSTVLDDLLIHNRYERNIVANKELIYDEELKANSLGKSKQWVVKDSLKFEEVPIIAPNGDELISKVTLKIKAGMNCVIEGPNGSGKTALLRVLAGLWPSFSGQLYTVHSDDIMFLPQRVYLPKGTLRDLVIYPDIEPEKTDFDLMELLKKVNLSYLVEREGGFDAKNDWYDVLSGGERQRISVARLFYHSPRFAVLDEATSAVSIEIENDLYLFAKNLGMTLITVTSRKSLFNFHDYAVILGGKKDWVLEEIKKEVE